MAAVYLKLIDVECYFNHSWSITVGSANIDTLTEWSTESNFKPNLAHESHHIVIQISRDFVSKFLIYNKNQVHRRLYVSSMSYQLAKSLCFVSLQWRHNERDGVSNHRRLDCLLSRLFRHRLKETSNLPVTGLCKGWPMDSPHKGPLTRKIFSFDGVIMSQNITITFGFSQCITRQGHMLKWRLAS